MAAVIHYQTLLVDEDVVRDSVFTQLYDMVYPVGLLRGQKVILYHGSKGRYAVLILGSAKNHVHDLERLTLKPLCQFPLIRPLLNASAAPVGTYVDLYDLTLVLLHHVTQQQNAVIYLGRCARPVTDLIGIEDGVGQHAGIILE